MVKDKHIISEPNYILLYTKKATQFERLFWYAFGV